MSELDDTMADVPLSCLGATMPFLFFFLYLLFWDFDYPLLFSYLSLAFLYILVCFFEKALSKEKTNCRYFIVSPVFTILGYYIVHIIFSANEWYSIVGAMLGFVFTFVFLFLLDKIITKSNL